MSGEGMRKSVRRKGSTRQATKHQGQLPEPQSPASLLLLWPQLGSLWLLTPVTGMPY